MKRWRENAVAPMKKTATQYRDEQLAKTRLSYGKIGKVYCPCISDYVTFNSDGLNHLLNDLSGRPRTIEEQIYKLKLFPLVIPTLKNCAVIDEKRDVEMRIGRKKNSPKKKVQYWALVHKVGRGNDVNVKVILRRIGTGNFHYWSVMKLGH